ncbi:MAG: DUF349 domain-containing protein [Actinobacteria bacterium]|nr:DUF349 domain-containing protein [Actinomycetota bacterium]
MPEETEAPSVPPTESAPPNPAAEHNPAAASSPAAALDSASAPHPATTPHPASAPHPGPAPVAKPGSPSGRPDPRPGAPSVEPAAAAEPVVAPVVIPVDPGAWGRIDEAGVVYVRTAAGERAVGEWQAGDAAAGLAHFGRRFDDFSTEIALLEARLASGAGDAKATRTQAAALKDSIPTLAAVGDLDGAATRLDAVIAEADAAIERASVARAQARAEAIAAKEALCVEAENLASSTQWKTSGDRLKAIVDEWRTIRGIDRKTDDALWKRFSRARDTFTRARGSHFADLDKQRLAARDVKEKLIKQAESLSTSRDWRETAAAYRDLMTEWKAVGRAPRDVEDQLWQRFRAAQEAFFARRNEVFAERDAEFEANATTKEKLLAEAEQIDPSADLDEAKRRLRSIQDRWEFAGKVPRERIHDLDARLRRVEDKVRAASDAAWRRTDPEATARVEQFRARVRQFRDQADKARAAGDARKAAEAEKQAETWEQWLRTAQSAVDG